MGRLRISRIRFFFRCVSGERSNCGHIVSEEVGIALSMIQVFCLKLIYLVTRGSLLLCSWVIGLFFI